MQTIAAQNPFVLNALNVPSATNRTTAARMPPAVIEASANARRPHAHLVKIV